jgi:D-alanine--poly(phosphoribitol) ligase subunit 1
MDVIGRIDGWGRTDPDRVAYVSGSRTLTYGELKAQSDVLAARLATELDDRSPIAIMGHKEPEMVVAFLACIKAGHAYVPLDTSLPRQRIDTILATSGVRLSLTPETVRQAVAEGGGSEALPNRQLADSDPFYIIFTSGSTGTPKGVPITYGCLVDFLSWMEDEQRFGAREVFLNQVPYSFDVSIMDTYLGLVTGGRVFCVHRDYIANPIRLYQALPDSRVTIWVSTPAFVQMCLAERRFDARMLPELRRFFLAGEALLPSIVAQLFDRFPQAEVWNMYGPTEATVVTTSVRIDRDMLARYPSLPIGFPKTRTCIAVLDESGAPVAPGERGEIVIAGPNVSPGYLNNPAASQRAFFRMNGLQAYRTGDVGHYRDGMVFFDGRIDDQIKLHGYRIEPGDVEAHIAALAGVREAVVLPTFKDGRPDSLQAFVVLSERPAGTDFDISNGLRARLAERLPAHMLPRRFRFLEFLPMTVNGKVDRRKLTAMD